jgi:septal ring factor EnvC (AmiA/AmiB activator)
MKRSIIHFLRVIAVFAILNVVLVGGQKLWHHGAQQRLTTLNAQLDAQGSEIKQREAELKTLIASSEQSSATIAGLRAHVQRIEDQYPSGIPQSMYPSYVKLVDQCNLLVAGHNLDIARYNSLYEDYSQRIERYNALVKEANATSKQIGGTWYVIPVPVPRYANAHSATKPR